MVSRISCLVVSNNPVFEQAVSDELHRSGFELFLNRAQSFDDAVAAIASREWDALLFDDDRRDESDALLNYLTEEGLDLPFILFSADTAVESVVKGIKAGAHDYIDREDLSRLAPTLTRALQQAQSRRKREKEAEEADSLAQNDFLSTLSHELRTPMTVFMGMVELTLHTRLTEEQNYYLASAMKSAESLLRLIEDLLDYAQLKQENVIFASDPFVLRDCIHAAIEKIAPRARQKGLSLIVSFADGVPETITGDADRLKQALEKLIDNAVKFTERGLISVCVSPDIDNGVLRFCVRDTGIGIPKEKKELIFRSFTQVENTNVRRFGGMGLGLALTHRIAARMGATLQVSSRIGAGSEFRLLLPWGAFTEKSDDSLSQGRRNRRKSSEPLKSLPTP
jgi:signal transduction histidine kinase